MAGIVSHGAYVPYYRLSKAEIARAWDMSFAPPGERAVANYDEDSLTMAVEAAMDCLKGVSTENIDGLFFASTTAPYKDKQIAATIATILGIKKDALTMDFGGSLRSGTNALRAAVEMVKSGSAKMILVCAAEIRLAYPTGMHELNFGDGAAAVLVGDDKVVAEIEGAYSIYEELQDYWRSDKDTFVRSAEDRFIVDKGFNEIVPKAVSAALKKFELSAKDFARFALYIPAQRQLGGVAKKLGFDPKTQCNDMLFSTVGDAGAAMSLMTLVQSLEEGKPGDRVLLAAYGNGCDVLIIKNIQPLEKPKGKSGLSGYLASKKTLSNYNRYLRWRDLVTVQPAPRPALEYKQPGPQAQWKENDKELRLRGIKCNKCGTPQYPPQRVCVNCGAKDDFEYYSFLDKSAKLFSFCHDYIMETPAPPVTVSVIDFDGGGRARMDMTDRDPEECKVGIPMRMTFRKLYYVGGIYNYWWKSTPRI